MIEVVAIDNRKAEAELLRLAADFAQSRLFLKKQAKRLAIVVEVSGEVPARPIARPQLAQKAGMFRSAKYHYDFCVSVGQGFETALLQMMHEFIHIAQIMTARYRLSSRSKKRNGEKIMVWHGQWCGKKAGIIDDIAWHERPWEQEAVAISEQLSQEFLSFIYGTQNQFEAQGGKKDLHLQSVALSLPEMPSQMQTESHHEADSQLPLAMSPPFHAQPQMSVPPQEMSQQEAEALLAPQSDMPAFDSPAFDTPAFDIGAFDAPISENDGSPAPADASVMADDALLADIDALLSQEVDTSKNAKSDRGDESSPAAFDTPIFDAPIFDVPSFDSEPQIMDQEAALSARPSDAPDIETEATKETTVAGFAAPRILKLSVLEAKQKELAQRGLLEK